MACPAGRIPGTRWASRLRRYSPVSWRRIAFPRFVRFERSFTSASLGLSGFGTTSPKGLPGERRVLPREQPAGGQDRGSRALVSQAWNNLLVPDEVPSQDDAGNGSAEKPAPAAEPAAEARKVGWIGRFRRRRRVATAIEPPRDGEPPSSSGADEEHQTTDTKVHVLPEDPPTQIKQRFAQLQAMHDHENEKTSPPDGEHVTFRSVTLAELYVGAEIDALAAALQKATWVNTDEQFAEEIATARQLDEPYTSEFLLRSSPGPSLVQGKLR